MSKAANTVPVKVPATDLSNCNKSTFTLTFALEIIGFEIWSDHKEGWLDIGPPLRSFKIQYQLYFGQNFTVDVLIYEQVAKIICGSASCWVRTWQYLERRWLTFSIRHACPVRAKDLKDFEVIVSVNTGGAPSAKVVSSQVFFPPLEFGQRRYFGNVMETLPTENETFVKWIREWIWNLVLDYIPPSPLDGSFDVPYPVADIRHQDSILYKIQEEILNYALELAENDVKELDDTAPSKGSPKKEKNKKGAEKKTFGLKISGNSILAGVGRLVAFESFGERSSDIGGFMIILSSANLPAPDDVPIVFINVGHLFQAPIEQFKRLNITHLYTRWSLGDEVHESQPIDIESLINQLDFNFNDSHALPLSPSRATEVTALFLDNPYSIELRGKRSPTEMSPANAKLFGYDKHDREYGTSPAPILPIEEGENGFVIAVTKIDTRTLARGLNTFISGEYPLFPPRGTVSSPSRQGVCTNDINMIRVPMQPELVVVPGCLVLAAQMTLEVSIGVVGCKPPKIITCFSRLYCIISDPNSVMAILIKVRKINDELAVQNPSTMLTGFALDTGDEVILFVEGPRDGYILKVWDMTEEYYPKVKPVFSTSARFSTRVYPEFLEAIMPFLVLKLYAPLALMLSCPSVYARPALPIPARIAALKFGRLLQNRYRSLPPRCELPTAAEMKSFRLELCAPPRTYPLLHKTYDKVNTAQQRERESSHHSIHVAKEINWQKD